MAIFDRVNLHYFYTVFNQILFSDFLHVPYSGQEGGFCLVNA